MKTISKKEGGKLLINRVSNQDAEIAVNSGGWKYCAKSVWKRNVRKIINRDSGGG